MISWDILNDTMPKFVKMKRWPFVLPVIEMVFATESLTAKCFRVSNRGFTTFIKKILTTIVECLEKMKLEHNECIDVRTKREFYLSIRQLEKTQEKCKWVHNLNLKRGNMQIRKSMTICYRTMVKLFKKFYLLKKYIVF